jgi:hypothetical protein
MRIANDRQKPSESSKPSVPAFDRSELRTIAEAP